MVRLVDLTTLGLNSRGVSDFSRGWRVDISNADGSLSGFDVTPYASSLGAAV